MAPARSRLLTHLAAVLLLTLTLSLRLSDLGSNPRGFFCDEASIAFNARAILEDGRDEYGVAWPLFFRSFGDYKSGIYIYAVAASTAVFGESPFASRLPATVFLTGLSLAVYLLLGRTVHPGCGLVAMALLLFEPWAHHFSHIAFNLTALPLLVTLAVGSFLWALVRRPLAMALPAVLFSLAFYVYAPARLLVPLLAGAALWSHRRQVLDGGWRRLLVFVITAILCAQPFVQAVRNPEFLARFDYLSVLHSDLVEHTATYQRLRRWSESHPLLAPLASDRGVRVLFAADTYLRTLSPRYLVVSGDRNLRHGSPHFGVLGWATGLGLLVGLMVLVRRRRPLDWLLLAWVAIFPLAAAVTWEDVPHSGRNIFGYPALVIIAAIGLWEVGRWRWRRPGFATWVSLIGCLWLGGGLAHQVYYRWHYTVEASGWMQYGTAEMMHYVAQHHDRYRAVDLISNGLHYVPYIFALYESGTSPAAWRQTQELPWKLWIRREPIGPRELRPQVLYVMTPVPDNLPAGLVRRHTVYWEDGKAPAVGFFTYEP